MGTSDGQQVEKVNIGTEQFGFMPSRCTTDAIFILRQDKKTERDKKTCIGFLLTLKRPLT
jgi:hypothetical protein